MLKCLVVFGSGKVLFLCVDGPLEVIWIPHELIVHLISVFLVLTFHESLADSNDRNFTCEKEERYVAAEYDQEEEQ